MNHRLILIFAGIFFFSSLLVSAKNQKPEPGSYNRPTKAGDFPGLWTVVKWTAYFKIPANSQANPYFQKNQWYLFSGDGVLKSMISGKKVEAKAVMSALKNIKAVIHYVAEDQGIVKTSRTDLPQAKETWKCFMITKEVSDPKKKVYLKTGDIVMTLMGKGNRVLYVRQMRKIAPAE